MSQFRSIHCDICRITFVERDKHRDDCPLANIQKGYGSYEYIGGYDCKCTAAQRREVEFHHSTCDWLGYYYSSAWELAGKFGCSCSRTLCEHCNINL